MRNGKPRPKRRTLKIHRNVFRCDYSQFPSAECENAVCIPLTKGRHTVIDAEDYELVCDRIWCCEHGYAGNTKAGPMHVLIMETAAGMETDHINGDPLDNRKYNLRVCTSAANQWNSRKMKGCAVKYKGVSKHKVGKYQASIRLNQRLVYIGLFEKEIDAAMAYDQYARQHRGEYARTNF